MNTLTHPGQAVRRLIADRKLTVEQAAAQIGTSRVAMSNIVNGNAIITPRMALKIERWAGVAAEDLIQAMAAHELARERNRASEAQK